MISDFCYGVCEIFAVVGC